MTLEETEPVGRRERKSLLKKYDIPLSHLDFGYIRELKNVKEMEKIYKILKSNETGHYEELTQLAEEKLKELSPNNRLLRKPLAALPKEYLDKSEQNSYLKEMKDWKDKIEAKEAVLRNPAKPNHILQPVRRTPMKIENSSNGNETEQKDTRIKSFDYKSWDSYDADKECLRIDLEAEKMQEEKDKFDRLEKERETKRQKMSLEEAAIDDIKDYVDQMANEERELMALKEKDTGNEYYKAHHLDEAIKHYTRSLYMYPTVSNYNNRAATYLKQCKFSKALEDLNVVIQMDPNNVKGRHRRAVAFQHKNEFHKALEDIRVVLAKEPHNILARHFADRLREDCVSLPKKHMLKYKDEEGETCIDEVVEGEMLTNYKDKDFTEVNEFGLPKIMCNCNGKFVDDPGIRHNDNIRFQHIRQRKQLEQGSHQASITSSCSNSVQPAIKPVHEHDVKPSLAGGGRRLEIVELESIYEDCEETPQTSCTVRDMRTVKDEKTTANLNIAHAATVSSINTIIPAELDKSDKMTWNKNVRQDEKDDESIIEEDAVKLFSDIPKRADIVEMMEAMDDDTSQPELVIDDKETWTDQRLQSSVSSVNSDFGKCMDLNGSHTLKYGVGDASDLNEKPVLKDCLCSEDVDSKPQVFLERWNSAKQEISPDWILKYQAALLQAVCPIHIPKVFSLNLNESILTDIINCLCYCYECEQKWEDKVILEYAHAVSKLQRFKIIICFVSGDSKKKMKSVFEKIGPSANYVQEFFR